MTDIGNSQPQTLFGATASTRAQIGVNEHTFTLSRIEEQFGVLVSADNIVIEVPTSLLPGEAHSGQIFKFKVERCENLEEQRKNELISLQKQILEDPNFFETDL